MLSAEQNERITRTGPGTPCGDMMRRYWQPAALAEELQGNRPARAIRLLGEDLVIFRDEDGRYGLIERQCCHRGADLAFGRLEDGGIRCPFHGWLFDVTGKCLDQPAEPKGSTFKDKVRQPAYPCVERNGIVFAYMGPLAEGEAPPAFPEFDCFTAPDSHSFAFKGLWECNWLQAMEVGVDPAHASYLHRFFDDDQDEYGLQFRGQTKSVAVTKVLREYDAPEINVEPTDYGLRISTLRDMGDGRMHIRVTNAFYPHVAVIPMSEDMTLTQWHVPVDDENCYWYSIFTAYGKAVDKAMMHEQRIKTVTLPDYRPVKNRSNNYGFDPEEQRSRTYTGMGEDINVHDQWAVESQGRIFDRTKEHLGSTDKAITAYRRMVFDAIDAVAGGSAPPMTGNGAAPAVAEGPVAIDTIGRADAWQEDWRAHERERREKSPWAGATW